MSVGLADDVLENGPISDPSRDPSPLLGGEGGRGKARAEAAPPATTSTRTGTVDLRPSRSCFSDFWPTFRPQLPRKTGYVPHPHTGRSALLFSNQPRASTNRGSVGFARRHANPDTFPVPAAVYDIQGSDGDSDGDGYLPTRGRKRMKLESLEL